MQGKEWPMTAAQTAWAGIGIITAASFILAFARGGGQSNGTEGFAILFLFDTIMAFLLFQVSDRRKRLYVATNIELNKLRRVYHVSKNLAATDIRFREWFTEMHGFLYGYLNAFADIAKGSYSDTNGAFRKLSYHVYAVPELQTAKEQALYADLLGTAAKVAETRQQIKELWAERIPAPMQATAVAITIGFAATVLASSEPPLFAGLALAMGLSVTLLVFMLDGMVGERDGLMARYVKNVAKLELGRQLE